MCLGRVDIPLGKTMKILFSSVFPFEQDWSITTYSVVIDVRLPRIIAGLLVGAALSISGASFQGVFQNPLVSPHILGVASGAGFGAALAILLFDSLWMIHLVSFLFGLASVGMTYALSRVYKMTPVLMLVLSGIVVGSLFSALTSFLKYIADPMNKMPAIVFWLLGSLNHVSTRDLLITAPVLVACIMVLLLVRWRINLLAMGEEDAKSLGVNTEVLKVVIIVSATIATASAVCISGIIGWIGIMIPHIGRLIVGPDHKYLLPISMVIGAAYLVAVDTIARTALVTEIPIGILTAILGAPVFAFLLRKSQKGA
ncbi:MAG: iron ABC transporter permease [Proteobacteria bacterium]|nr:iron ABC transporter permease [Pseudomonadota bacterium]MBU1583093.1 iron ABC transporter permease [Pseudomonadota bacterium]MBU2453713.1 iron ABC transporter permease [Pseudomonadota bacterium]